MLGVQHAVVTDELQERQSRMELADARVVLSEPLDPLSWRSLTNYAAAHYLVGEMPVALAAAEQAVELDRNSSTLFNLAVVYEAYGRWDDVRPLAEEVHAIAPHHHALSSVLAESRLRDGRWREGWPIYVLSYVPETPLHQYIPKWTGHEDLRGKRLLLVQNGGIGDIFNFSRFLPRLKRWGARITYCGPSSVCPLIASQPYIDAALPTHDWDQKIDRVVVRDYDYITTVMELPGNLDITLDDQLWYGPYIYPVHPRERDNADYLVGVCWEAGEYVYPRRRRSLNQNQLDRILSVHRPHLRWVNLQYDATLPAADNPPIVGWLATASVVAGCDLVVSVDTATAHLAGAMNIPVWVPLCGASAGLWLRYGSTVPYYPSMTLFRNDDLGLDHAVESLARALESL